MNEIYCSRREASPQLVGTNNAKTKASFCEVFFRISGDGAHFVKFFPGLSFLSEKIRSPARGGHGSQGADFSARRVACCSFPIAQSSIESGEF